MDGGFCKRQKMVNQRKINKKAMIDHRFFFMEMALVKGKNNLGLNKNLINSYQH